MRQEQDSAAVISNHEHLPQSVYKFESGFDWEGRALLLQDGFTRSTFRRIVGKNTLVQVVASHPLPVTGLGDAPMESLHALPLELARCFPFLG